ncbi:MAG: site-specific recombinase, invertase Pin [Mucilaginibacter sp.]|nr:site-specific recombinase, invertase Pin [Mucilaginibacter sp.]
MTPECPHSTLNISGNLLYDKYEQLISHLHFRMDQVEKIVKYIQEELVKATTFRAQELEAKKGQLIDAERKLASLEDKILNDVINGDTYKKGYKKFSMEIARLKSEIADLSEDLTAKANEQIALIPELLRLPSLFERATLNQQHSILNRVFKQGLTFKDEGFRTPWFNPQFGHNYQVLNEKRLLETEQPLEDFSIIPFCGDQGTPLQHLQEILRIIREVYNEKQ